MVALFNAEFGIRHRGSSVPERSGVALSFPAARVKNANAIHTIKGRIYLFLYHPYYFSQMKLFLAHWFSGCPC
jgi:hypothetical protein